MIGEAVQEELAPHAAAGQVALGRAAGTAESRSSRRVGRVGPPKVPQLLRIMRRP